MARAIKASSVVKSHSFSLILLGCVLAGAVLGLLWPLQAAKLKPLGDVFLNLLFTAVVPLVFFSISSAVSGMHDMARLRRILIWMIIVFVVTGLVSGLFMITMVKIFPPHIRVMPDLPAADVQAHAGLAESLVRAFTVPDFAHLLSKQNMLPLILFAFLTGLAASLSGEKGRPFAEFLASGNEVMMKLLSFLMLYAPVGLGAYFGYFVARYGPDLLGTYLSAMALYYPVAIFYYAAGYTFYAWLAGGGQGVRLYWRSIVTPSLTALATGSSLATIPANLEATDQIGVPREVSRIVVPIGATIQMDGTCLSAILKISILFHFFGMNFSGVETLALALGVALLSAMVMSGIPGGGFLGELMIVTLYGFPPEALPLISMLGTLVDPPATMLNATGDTVMSMLVARLTHGKKWRDAQLSSERAKASAR